MKVRLFFALVGLATLSLLDGSVLHVRAEGARVKLAVIVNADNGVSDLSLVDLQKIFKAGKTRWESGDKVRITMRSIKSNEGRCALEAIYNMGAKKYKKYWIKKVFRGEVAKAPKQFSSDDSVIAVVGTDALAIGLVNVESLDSLGSEVKVVTVDGKAVTAGDYPVMPLK